VEVRAPAEQTEGTRSQVLRWLKSIGEQVAENEPLIEIETDKVTVEVASPGSGVLCEILKGEQEEITPGEVLGRIDVKGLMDPVPPDVVDVPEGARRPKVGAATPPVGAAATRLSPAVRRLLAEHALDPATLRGTGMGGRITVEDVLSAVAAAGGVSSPARPEVTGGSHRIPHTPLRKRIAEHMVHSLLHTAPHVTTVFDVDMTAVLAHRQKYREEFAGRGVPLTLTAYFLQAIVAAVGVVPEANSRWTDAELEVFDSIHVGVGTALEEGGLVVPVLRDVQSRDLFSTAEGLNDLVTRAREGRLTPVDVRGGTFTISNHGVSGSLWATPIVINQPQAAILGVGKLEKRAVVMEEAGGEDKVVIQPRCYVTLTLDHRVMDGHQANRFMQRFVTHLRNWP
jgi:2-oxoglutarate dehydrogenase E2 component (dihydrolipoamide succinyltransferase)